MLRASRKLGDDLDRNSQPRKINSSPPRERSDSGELLAGRIATDDEEKGEAGRTEGRGADEESPTRLELASRFGRRPKHLCKATWKSTERDGAPRITADERSIP